MVRLLLFFQFLVPFFAAAQTPFDSLMSEWRLRKNQPADTVTVRLLLDISAAYKFDNTDSAVFYAIKAEEYSGRLEFPKGMGDALTAKGIGYYIMGNYDHSLTAHTRALEIHKQTGSSNGMALSYNGIGLVYLGQEDLLRAIPYFRQASALNTSSGNHSLLANNYFNMGIAYDHLEQFDSAHHYLELAETTADIAGNFRTKLMINNRVAETLFRQKRYGEALQQYQEVLDAEYFQSNWETTFAYAGLAQTYIELGNYKKAVEAGEHAVEYGKRVGAKWDIERALGILAEAYARENDFENAFLTHKLYKAYSDSLFNEEKETEINYLFLKQKETENQDLLRENELKGEQLRQNRLINIISAVALASFTVIGLILIRSSRVKEKLNKSLQQKNDDIRRQKGLIEEQNEKLANLNKTNALILSIISHDLRSPIASIQSMMHFFKEGNISATDQKEIFGELEKRVNSIASMMNGLLNWAGSQFTGLKANFEPVVISDVVAELLVVFDHRLKEKAIAINHRPPQLPPQVQADPSQLRIILQNLISNAIKFTHKEGVIDIFYMDSDEYFSVHIKDSGVGMDKQRLKAIQTTTGKRVTDLGTEQEQGTGLGLILTRQFVEYNNGTLTVNSRPGEGSEFIVSLRKT